MSLNAEIDPIRCAVAKGVVTLRPVTADDLELLRHWNRQPHVVAAVGDDWGWGAELARKFDWRERLIAELDGRPIGFIQIIDPAREETHSWSCTKPGRRAIDLWIGEASDLGRGYGTQMMKLVIERCSAKTAVSSTVSRARTRRPQAPNFA